MWSHGTSVLAATLAKPERIGVTRVLRPAGLLQDVQVLPGWTVIQGYTTLWQGLCAIPGMIADSRAGGEPVSDANLVAFSYDFRQSNRVSAQRLDGVIREQLRRLGRIDEPDSVVIVAHSMGGLIARHWIANLGGHELCHALMTLGTPHRGAPKALDVLANGVPVVVGPLTRRAKRLGNVLSGWESMTELLPRYPCIADPRAVGGGVRVQDVGAFGGRWAGLAEQGERALLFQEEIEDGWRRLERHPIFRAHVGISQPTTQSATISDHGIEVSELAPVWCDLGVFVMDAGDGTVPGISAFPITVEDTGTYERAVTRVAASHGRIGNDEEAIRFVELREGLAVRRTGARGNEARVALGLSAPDLVASGAPVEVSVSLDGVVLDSPDRQAVYVSVEPATLVNPPGVAEGQRPVRAEWDPDAARYRARLPALPEGCWSIRAQAGAVPRAGDLQTVRDLVAVDLVEVDG